MLNQKLTEGLGEARMAAVFELEMAGERGNRHSRLLTYIWRELMWCSAIETDFSILNLVSWRVVMVMLIGK